jgi:hypothetical protein
MPKPKCELKSDVWTITQTWRFLKELPMSYGLSFDFAKKYIPSSNKINAIFSGQFQKYFLRTITHPYVARGHKIEPRSQNVCDQFFLS